MALNLVSSLGFLSLSSQDGVCHGVVAVDPGEEHDGEVGRVGDVDGGPGLVPALVEAHHVVAHPLQRVLTLVSELKLLKMGNG